MNTQQGFRYTILEIHPRDNFYVQEKELVGKTVIMGWGRKNRQVEGEWLCCEVALTEPTEHYVAGNMFFFAVKLGELI